MSQESKLLEIQKVLQRLRIENKELCSVVKSWSKFNYPQLEHH